MDKSNVILVVLGGLVLAFTLLSRRLSMSPFPATLLALAYGILLGPAVLGVIDIRALGDQPKILEDAARLTLGIGLIGVALRIPRHYPRRNWREMALLLGLAMPLMCAASTMLVYLILGIDFWLAALIGAMLSPTDPVASATIVAGPVAQENIPERLRHAISFESAANDGLGFPFVLLAFLMLTNHPPGAALSAWLLDVLLRQVVLGTAAGLLAGYAAGRLLRAAEARNLVAREWRPAYAVALALFAVGAGKLIHCDEILVVFAAGAAFVQAAGDAETSGQESVQGAVERFFSAPIFAVLGIAIPWAGWQALGWHGVALALAVMLLRRVPALLLLRPLLPSIHSTADVLFTGWFGPIAVAAIYYAGFMQHALGEPRIWDVVSLVVCTSVVIHGMSAAPLTRLYSRIGRKAH